MVRQEQLESRLLRIRVRARRFKDVAHFAGDGAHSLPNGQGCSIGEDFICKVTSETRSQRLRDSNFQMYDESLGKAAEQFGPLSRRVEKRLRAMDRDIKRFLHRLRVVQMEQNVR